MTILRTCLTPSASLTTVCLLLAGVGFSACNARPADNAVQAETGVVVAQNPALSPMTMSRTGAAAPALTGAAPQATPVQPTAAPPGGLSIAETWAKRASLSGQSVTVRGTVVKVNNGIMGSNWFHLQDGSGKASDGTNDLTVTTDAVVKIGDVITASGTLATKKDFGAGYVYEAILEKASISR